MNNNVVREITYLGRTKKFTNDFDLLSESEYNEIVAKWYEKADRDTVNEEILLFDEGGIKFAEITDYYFRVVILGCRENTAQPKIFHKLYTR